MRSRTSVRPLPFLGRRTRNPDNGPHGIVQLALKVWRAVKQLGRDFAAKLRSLRKALAHVRKLLRGSARFPQRTIDATREGCCYTSFIRARRPGGLATDSAGWYKRLCVRKVT